MDALVPAFVAALLAGIGDRPARFAAILADRHGRPLTVLVAFGLAQAAAAALAAAAAAAVAAMLTPDARTLMLGLALLSAALGGIGRPRPPARAGTWRLGAFATTLLGGFVLAFGDRTAFLTFGIAARSSAPALAAAGAAAGSLAVAFVAVACGEAAWQRLPLRRLSAAAAAMLGVAGMLTVLSALGILWARG